MNLRYQFLVFISILILYCSIISAQSENITFFADSRFSNDPNYKFQIEQTIKEINQFTLSDSIWKMWQAIKDSQFVVPPKDSFEALIKLSLGSQQAKKAVEILQYTNVYTINPLEKNKIELDFILELEKARLDLEESIKLNPYDQRTQKWLIWVFQQLADMYAEHQNYIRSTTMLEYLAYILKDDPQLYYKLGENYLWLNDWENARKSLQKSINLILDTDWEFINTDELFSHYYLRAEAEIKLGLVSEALLTLNYAKSIAPTQQDAQRIQWQIDWINWDNGNIANSIKYDELKEKFKDRTDYHQLKLEYLALLNQLSTSKAQNEILWQIAKLEFQYLNEMTQAINRLFTIINKVTSDSFNIAIDTEYQKYLNDYGLMCYNLGVKNLKKNDYKLAFIYFTQSVVHYWEGIGKSYVQLAYLTSINNDLVIKYCDKALQFKNSLSSNEIYQTYQLLFNAYKRKGKFSEAATWYLKLVDFQL